jgi:hypothetical protein
MIGKKVIVRADRAGVFFGTLKGKTANTVILTQCRKLWSWSGANAVEEIAKHGVVNPNDCKFTVIVDEMEIYNQVQVIPCTDEAIKIIEGVKEWKRK